MKTEDRDKLLDEWGITEETQAFLKSHAPRVQQDGEFTRLDAERIWGLKPDAAVAHLKRLVDQGVLDRTDNVLLKQGGEGSVWKKKG